MSSFIKKTYPLLEGTVNLLGLDKNELRKKMIQQDNKKCRIVLLTFFKKKRAKYQNDFLLV